MAALATEMTEVDEHISAVTLKLDDHPKKVILARAESPDLPVYLHNNATHYYAIVSRFFYEADLSVTRIPDDSDADDAEVDKVNKTTRVLVTIQRGIVCKSRPSVETRDTDPWVPV